MIGREPHVSRHFSSMRPIRHKIIFCLAVLLMMVLILSGVGITAISLYRNSVRDINWRADTLPVSSEIGVEIEELRSIFEKIQFLNRHEAQRLLYNTQLEEARLQFQTKLDQFQDSLNEYSLLLHGRESSKYENEALKHEQSALEEILFALEKLKRRTEPADWISRNVYIEDVGEELRKLRNLSGNIPKYQLNGLKDSSEAAKNQYHTLYTLVLLSGVTCGILLGVLLRLGYIWVFRPLSILIDGSKKIASGQFQHRIELDTRDDMADLADAMNEMTDRFQSICSDLNQQIFIRSQEAVRNERLASVGFLAAGVAHEINNPLASIAMCSESLQRRLEPLVRDLPESQENIVAKYLKMIQDEAFRCKKITEKLLDFARTEKKTRESANLSQLIYEMVEMLAHHGDYRNKEVRLNLPESLYAIVNPQEIKQVLLNLLTNALDSIGPGGKVRVKLFEKNMFAQIIVEDDGCGMDTDVLQNVFEPFYTRKKQGQGTGLGLSISHRIISDHHGRIEASSLGVGKGSIFRVELPISDDAPQMLSDSYLFAIDSKRKIS